MRKVIAAVFGLVLTVTVLMTAVTIAAVGQEQGTFPDRTFEVWKAAGGSSYVASIVPAEAGIWWVSVESFTGSFVTVRVYETVGEATKMISSSRLSSPGQESEHVGIVKGNSYTVKLSVAGKAASAVLQEHFLLSGPQVHDPILIQSDAEFTPENGVVGGQGTQADPYRISGWHIDASSADGIRVENTVAYFVIENVLVDAGIYEWTTYDGVHLMGVAHGLVTQSTFQSTYHGVAVEQSTMAGVSDTYCNDCVFGVRVSGSTDAAVVQTTTNDCYGGMIAEYSTVVVFSGNTIAGSEAGGLLIDSSTYCSVVGNSFSDAGMVGAGAGIVLWGSEVAHFNTHDISSTNLVMGNPILYFKDTSPVIVESVPIGQLIVANCQDVVASQLTISDTDSGVQLAFVTSASIRQCVMERDGNGVRAMYSAMIEVSDCTIGPTGSGVWLMEVAGAVVEDCWISSPQEEGLILGSCSDVLLARNTIEGCQEGLTVDSCSEVLVSENAIVGNSEGVMGSSSTDLILSGNLVQDNGAGVWLTGCNLATIYGNSFIGNSWVQAYDTNPSANWWWHNYWSDYSGVDEDGDGVGDTSYYFDVGSQDYGPLMSPPQVNISVSTDKHWYSAGELVTLTMLVTNTGSTTVTLAFPSSIQEYCMVEDFWFDLIWDSRYGAIVLPWVTYLTIDPGEALTYTFTWPQTYNEGSQVPYPDSYLVEGAFDSWNLVLSGLTLVGIC